MRKTGSAAAVLAAVVLAAFLGGLALVVDRELSRRMDDLQAATMAALEQALGRRVSYGSISPSLVRSVEIRDLKVYSGDGSGAVVLAIDRLRVYYSLVRLMTGRNPVAALREIRILDSRFSVDLERDRDLLDLLARLAEVRPQEGSALDSFAAKLTGANVAVRLVSPQGSLDVGGLYFEAAPEADALEVSLRCRLAGALPDGFSFSTDVRALGRVGRRLDWSDLTVRVRQFTSTLLSTGRQTVQVVWKEGQVKLDKIQDRSPVDLSLAADLAARTVRLEFRSQDFRPDSLFRLEGELAGLNKWLKAPLTASGSVTYGLDNRSLVYGGSIEAFFEDQLPVASVVLAASVRGTHRQIWLEPLSLDSPSGSLAFVGNMLFENYFPEGVLTLSDVDAWQGERVSATLSLVRLAGRLEVTGTRARIGQIGFDRLEAMMEPGPEGTAFRVGASFDGLSDDAVEAQGVLAKGSITFSAGLRSAPADRLFHLALGAADLTRAQEDTKAFLEPLRLTADITGSTDLKTFLAATPVLGVSHAGRADSTISAAVELGSDHLAVTGLQGRWQGIAVRGDLRGRQGQGGALQFSTELRIQDMPYSLSGSYSLEAGLSATGSYGLSIAASRSRTGVLAVKARAAGFPIPTPNGRQVVSFEGEGTVAKEGQWRIVVPSIEILDLPVLASRKNSLELSLKADARRLEIARIRFTDGFSQLEGSAEADLTGAADPLNPRFLGELAARGSVRLAGRGTPETWSLRGTLDKGALDAQVDVVSTPLARAGDLAVKGFLSASGTVRGTVEAPVADISVSLKEGKLGTDPLGASARVLVDARGLAVRDLEVSYVSHKLSTGVGSIDFGKGAFSLAGLYTGAYFVDDRVRLSALLQGTFSAGSWEQLAARPLEQEIAGRLSLDGITVNATPMPSWGLSLRSEGGSLRMDGGPGESLHGVLASDLSFTFSTAAPLPVTSRVEGKLARDRISAAVDVASLDLRVLNPILKSPIVSFTSGVASGRLSVAGPVNDPDYLGSLEVIGGGILCRSYSPDEAGPISTRFVFDGRGFRSDPVVAAVGSARMAGQVSFTIDHWVPVTFDISLASVGDSAVHLAAKFGSLNVDGRGVGSARIVGNQRRADVTGSLVVSDCRITLGPYPGGEFRAEDPPTYAQFTVETGRRVEFLWPSAAFPVLRTTAAAGGRAEISYRGDTGGYTIKGSTDVRGGEIFYFDRSFVVKSGAIVFDETEKSFDPRITARAEVREWDPETGEEVRIYLDADSRLSAFSPRFSSDPSRTDVQILAMIGAPILGRAEEQGLGVSALMLSSDILSQFGILRPFEQRIRQLLNLDMFSIRTQIVQNLLAERLFGAVVNPLDNTAVSLGKYLGNDLFLEMLVRLQSRPAAAGGAGPASALASEVELNIEWATPFFLLEWSFLPRTPETLFLADNSLSMKWRYSY